MQRTQQNGLPCRYFGSPGTIERDRGPHRQLRLALVSPSIDVPQQAVLTGRLSKKLPASLERHQSDARDRLPSAALDHTSDPVDVAEFQENQVRFVPRALDGGLRFMREEFLASGVSRK